MQIKNPQKTVSAIAVASAALFGLSNVAEAQELFGAYSDYSQNSGYDLQEHVLADSDLFELFKFGVRAGFTFDDNIFLTDGNEESDMIFKTDIIMSVKNRETAENSWVLTYIPTFKLYTNYSDLNGVDHNVNAGFSKTFAKSLVRLGADYASIFGSNRYVAGQVQKDALGADIYVSHELSGKTRADLTFDFSGEDFGDNSTLVGRNRYTTRLSALYQLTGKTNIGPYLGYEYTSVKGGSDQKSASFGANVEYQAMAKTSLNGFIGIENRDFTDSTMNDRPSLNYNLGASHLYSGKLSFDASLYRNTRPGYTSNSNSFTTTGAYLGARHRTTERVSLRTRINYAHDDYFGPTSDGLDSDYVSLSIGGDYLIPIGLRLGADLTFRTKTSDNSTNFDNTIFQVNASYYF